jgi:hypothetical protein
MIQWAPRGSHACCCTCYYFLFLLLSSYYYCYLCSTGTCRRKNTRVDHYSLLLNSRGNSNNIASADMGQLDLLPAAALIPEGPEVKVIMPQYLISMITSFLPSSGSGKSSWYCSTSTGPCSKERNSFHIILWSDCALP